MSAQDEIRELFKNWWAASARMDIEASMAPIATDIVSYEHNTPLRYRGVGAVRAVCQTGFDLMEKIDGDFTWTVDDLQIEVSGDIAAAWGINRMVVRKGGATTYASSSRGSWIFRRRDGAWTLIHQHQSYPFDPATGHAVFDSEVEAEALTGN